MNEQTTRELIERFLEAANSSNQDEMQDCLCEDVVQDINQGEREIGREKFRWRSALQARHFREQYSDIVIMVALGGGRAAAEFTLRGTYLASAEGLPAANGQSFALPAGIFFEIDEGCIVRLSWHYNRTQMIAQLQKG